MDPFMYLTVPLPIAQYRQFECRFYPRDPEADPLNIRMSIPANASFAQVKDKLGALVDANPAHVSKNPNYVVVPRKNGCS